MERWSGRVAVVTGASAGIGKEVAKELVKHGLVVVGIARTVEKVQELAKELKGEKGVLHAVKADITKEKDVLDAFAWIEKNTGGIDVLVNNAGIARFDSLLDGKTEAWRQILDLNVIGLSMCAREAVKSMKKKGANDGIVINVNSIAGQRILHEIFNMYSASKFAVRALSEALYKELAASGSSIRVTNLSPGAVGTEFAKHPEMNYPANVKFPSFDQTKILQPSDLAQAVVFILSVDNRVYIPELTLQQNFEIKPDHFDK